MGHATDEGLWATNLKPARVQCIALMAAFLFGTSGCRGVDIEERIGPRPGSGSSGTLSIVSCRASTERVGPNGQVIFTFSASDSLRSTTRARLGDIELDVANDCSGAGANWQCTYAADGTEAEEAHIFHVSVESYASGIVDDHGCGSDGTVIFDRTGPVITVTEGPSPTYVGDGFDTTVFFSTQEPLVGFPGALARSVDSDASISALVYATGSDAYAATVRFPSAFADGQYVIEISARDEAGNEGTYTSAPVTKDFAPPNLSAEPSATDIGLSFVSASGGDGPMVSVSFSANEEIAMAEGNFGGRIGAEPCTPADGFDGCVGVFLDGTETGASSLTAWDLAGNPRTIAIPFHFDFTPPSLQIISKPSYVDEPATTVVVVIDNEVRPLTQASATLVHPSGDRIVLTPFVVNNFQSIFEIVPRQYFDGDFTLEVTVVDSAGNATTKTVATEIRNQAFVGADRIVPLEISAEGRAIGSSGRFFEKRFKVFVAPENMTSGMAAVEVRGGNADQPQLRYYGSYDAQSFGPLRASSDNALGPGTAMLRLAGITERGFYSFGLVGSPGQVFSVRFWPDFTPSFQPAIGSSAPVSLGYGQSGSGSSCNGFDYIVRMLPIEANGDHHLDLLVVGVEGTYSLGVLTGTVSAALNYGSALGFEGCSEPFHTSATFSSRSLDSERPRDWNANFSPLMVEDISEDGMVDVVFSYGLTENAVLGTALAPTVVVIVNIGSPLPLTSTISLDHGTSAVTLSDVDGDGLKDIVTIKDSEEGYWYKNLSQGIFSVAEPLRFTWQDPQPALFEVREIRALDLDGDSIDEWLLGGSVEVELAVFEPDGTGGFAESRRFAGSGNAYNYDLKNYVVADLNDDGQPDIATSADNSTATYAYINDGGRLQQVSRAGYDFPLDAQLIEINGDGFGDFVGDIGSGSNDSIIKGDGTGLQNTSAGFWNTNEILTTAAAGDFNSDGSTDLLLSGIDGTVLLARDLSTPDQYSDPFMGVGPVTVHTASMLPRRMRIEDINGDGINDVIGLSWSRTSVRVTEQNSWDTYDYGAARSVTVPTTQDFTLADMDGDGDRDLVLAMMDGIGISLFDGTQFVAPTTEPTSNMLMDIEVCDVDADGDIDVFVVDRPTTGNSQLHHYTNDGGGGLSLAESVSLAGRAEEIQHADFDQDGRCDIAVLHADSIQTVLDTGAGYLANAVMLLDALDPGAGASGHTLLVKNLLTQTGTELWAFALTSPARLPMLYGTIADSSGNLSAHGSAAKTKLENGFTTDVSLEVAELSAADFNRDGRPDLLASWGGIYGYTNGTTGVRTESTSGRTSMLLNVGNEQFSAPNTAPATWAIGAISDHLDDDGNPDVLGFSYYYRSDDAAGSQLFYRGYKGAGFGRQRSDYRVQEDLVITDDAEAVISQQELGQMAFESLVLSVQSDHPRPADLSLMLTAPGCVGTDSEISVLLKAADEPIQSLRFPNGFQETSASLAPLYCTIKKGTWTLTVIDDVPGPSITTEPRLWGWSLNTLQGTAASDEANSGHSPGLVATLWDTSGSVDLVRWEQIQARPFHTWGSTAPAAGISPESFRARWQGLIWLDQDTTAAGQSYVFRLGTDSNGDRVSLTLDGLQVFDAATGTTDHQNDPSVAPTQLTRGWHAITLEYEHDSSDPAALRLYHSAIPLPPGQLAQTPVPAHVFAH